MAPAILGPQLSPLHLGFSFRVEGPIVISVLQKRVTMDLFKNSWVPPSEKGSPPFLSHDESMSLDAPMVGVYGLQDKSALSALPHASSLKILYHYLLHFFQKAQEPREVIVIFTGKFWQWDYLISGRLNKIVE